MARPRAADCEVKELHDTSLEGLMLACPFSDTSNLQCTEHRVSHIHTRTLPRPLLAVSATVLRSAFSDAASRNVTTARPWSRLRHLETRLPAGCVGATANSVLKTGVQYFMSTKLNQDHATGPMITSSAPLTPNTKSPSSLLSLLAYNHHHSFPSHQQPTCVSASVSTSSLSSLAAAREGSLRG